MMYVHVPITADRDPTGDTVEMAFSPAYADEPTSFVTASWTGPATPPVPGVAPSYQADARCLVGPGGDVTLPLGSYRVWTKITDTPEIPVLASDILTVF